MRELSQMPNYSCNLAARDLGHFKDEVSPFCVINKKEK